MCCINFQQFSNRESQISQIWTLLVGVMASSHPDLKDVFWDVGWAYLQNLGRSNGPKSWVLRQLSHHILIKFFQCLLWTYIYMYYWQILAWHYCYVFECPYIYTIYILTYSTSTFLREIQAGRPRGSKAGAWKWSTRTTWSTWTDMQGGSGFDPTTTTEQGQGNTPLDWAYLRLALFILFPVAAPLSLVGILYVGPTKSWTFSRGPKGCHVEQFQKILLVSSIDRDPFFMV